MRWLAAAWSIICALAYCQSSITQVPLVLSILQVDAHSHLVCSMRVQVIGCLLQQYTGCLLFTESNTAKDQA